MSEKNNDITKKFKEDEIQTFQDFNETSKIIDPERINLNLDELRREMNEEIYGNEEVIKTSNESFLDNNLDNRHDFQEENYDIALNVEEPVMQNNDENLSEPVSQVEMPVNLPQEKIEEHQEVIPEKEEVPKNLNIEENKFLASRNKPIISFKNTGLSYKDDVILDGVNLDIYKGEFVYLVGESGAGKSSIIKMIYREVLNTEGDIFIKGENISILPHSKLPRLRRMIGVIFQDYKLLKDKTIFQNVAYSLQVTHYPKKKIKDRVNYVLEKVGILEHADKYPDELSGGQQQRAAIARAIVDEPEILVADEPTGNLDPENALAIMEILETINMEGTTIVMATHDVGIVNNFPKRVILLGDGNILKETKGEYIYE